MQEAPPTDGRTLRSLRTREAIVDATIGLLEDGDLRPTAPRVAERAGVSVRSVFQHFDDLETLHASVAERLVDRVAVLVLPVPPDLPLAERLDRFVHQRALLLEAVTPIRRAADVHGPSRRRSPPDSVTARRSSAPSSCAPSNRSSHAAGADRDDVLDCLDSALSWATWEGLRHGLGRDQATAERVMRRLAERALT